MKNTTVKIYIGGGNCSEDPIKKFIKNLNDIDPDSAFETRKKIADLIKNNYNQKISKFVTASSSLTDMSESDIESYTLNINNTITNGYIKKISENGNCLYNSFAFAYLFNNKFNNNDTPYLNKWIPQEDFSKNIYSGNLRNVLAKYICENSGNIIESQIVTRKNLDEALDVVKKWDVNEVLEAYSNAPKKGLSTSLMGKDLLYWSSVILNISKKGLTNRNILNKKGMNEEKFIDHLFRIIENKKTNADHMLYKFSKDENLANLYDQ